jgi:hypothetical protein
VASVAFTVGANSGGTTPAAANHAGGNPAGAQSSGAPLRSGVPGNPRLGFLAGAPVVGTVASKTGTTIVVTTTAGQAVTVDVSPSTKFTIRGATNPTIDNIAVGNRIAAQGTFNADGSFNATQVQAGALGEPGFGGGFGRGRGGGSGFPSPAPSGAST